MTDLDLAQALVNALAECPTCEGTGKFTPECYACLCGEGPCTCKTEPEQDCPTCGKAGEYVTGEITKGLFQEWRKKYPKL